MTSGIRIGTPALTTRGMGEGEMARIAEWIAESVKHPEDDAKIEAIRKEVETLANRFPLFDK